MKKKRKQPRDLNLLAKSIIDIATSEEEPVEVDDGKNPAALALGRLVV
jgi:hypothetical protein